ncbi:MAG: hypothetical protein ACXVZ2_05635 [Gaiellaceae bacterium]
MRTLALVSLVAAVLTGATVAGARAPIAVTFVGDSVSASISYVPAARAELRHGLRVHLDLKVCRRLVQPSCSFQGVAPSTALQAARSYGHSLGQVLVVNVGYNESAKGYREGIDRVMRTALAQGAKGVVWITLREDSGYRSVYHATNGEIRAAARRWPQLVVADWNAYSRGKPWFRSDGLHLTPTGAVALATFLRPYVFRAAGTAG